MEPLVLVVEDHEDTRVMIMCLLEMWGYRVATAQDGEAAVYMAGNMHPDLIMMDASLPRLSGLEATRRIREDPALDAVPVVFLSGYAETSLRRAVLETGCSDYLTKPFEIEQLQALVQRHLGTNQVAVGRVV